MYRPHTYYFYCSIATSVSAVSLTDDSDMVRVRDIWWDVCRASSLDFCRPTERWRMTAGVTRPLACSILASSFSLSDCMMLSKMAVTGEKKELLLTKIMSWIVVRTMQGRTWVPALAFSSLETNNKMHRTYQVTLRQFVHNYSHFPNHSFWQFVRNYSHFPNHTFCHLTICTQLQSFSQSQFLTICTQLQSFFQSQFLTICTQLQSFSQSQFLTICTQLQSFSQSQFLTKMLTKYSQEPQMKQDLGSWVLVSCPSLQSREKNWELKAVVMVCCPCFCSLSQTEKYKIKVRSWGRHKEWFVAPAVYSQEKRSKMLELWSRFVALSVYNQEKRSKILGLWSRFVAPAVRSENLGQAGVMVCCVYNLQSGGKKRNLGVVVISLHQSR